MTKIFITDDEPDICYLLSDELTRAGFVVKAATDSSEAIMAAAEEPFDLFLLDMLMPGLDGVKTIKVLRKIAPDVPIIGLTGYVGRGYMAEAASLGVTCLSKPIDIDELITEINEILF